MSKTKRLFKPKQCPACKCDFIPTGASQYHCPSCRPKQRRQLAKESAHRSRARGAFRNKCPQCGEPKQKLSRVCQPCYTKSLALHPEACPNWKGGKKLSRGYVLVWSGKGTYDFEHHLVWEQTHGKKLPKNWNIHHINGIKNDNRKENLVAVRRNHHEYQTLLKAAQKRIKELEQLHFTLDGAIDAYQLGEPDPSLREK